MPYTIAKACAAGLSMLAVANAGTPQKAPGSSIQSFLINYNFETYPSSSSQLPVAATVVNDYDLLHFNTILVNQTQPTLGVACHTAPACTAFTLNSALLSGLLTPGQNAPSLGPAYITAKYLDSPITYFDPYAFYYGCVAADLNGAASVPVTCTITANGVNSKGKSIYTQTFPFTATTGATLQQMKLGYFDQGWSGLQVQTLYLTVTNNATTAALIDNLVASVYGPQNAAVLVDF